MPRTWRALTEEQRTRAARFDPRQASLFGQGHTKELEREKERKKSLRAFYAQLADEVRERHNQ